MLASMLILLLPRRGHYRALVVPHTCRRERTSLRASTQSGPFMTGIRNFFFTAPRAELWQAVRSIVGRITQERPC